MILVKNVYVVAVVEKEGHLEQHIFGGYIQLIHNGM